jgi:hypothetical protein
VNRQVNGLSAGNAEAVQNNPAEVRLQDTRPDRLRAVHRAIAAAYAARDLNGIRAGAAEAAFIRDGSTGLVHALEIATPENVPGTLRAALDVLARNGQFTPGHLDPLARVAHARGLTEDEINAALDAMRGGARDE